MLKGHKAKWTIYQSSGQMLLSLDCLYDCNDFLAEIAEAWEIDYKTKQINIIKELYK